MLSNNELNLNQFFFPHGRLFVNQFHTNFLFFVPPENVRKPDVFVTFSGPGRFPGIAQNN